MFAIIFAVAAFFTSAVVAAPGYGSSLDSASTSVVNAPSVSECNYTGGNVCCNSLDYDQGAISESLLSAINVPIDANLLVGHGCSPLIGIAEGVCNAQAACCEKTYSGIGINCNNIAA
ncbi:hypothetical protein BDV98DRAFT_657308 [Pterulicium gracile]|uniref:Hydrophobin n=1 Tax=Pterulicium gracile TaxID=1884261 RepID=A0A5C3QBS1_9AGAR|nr:hypothetical protein BDV98DRAFT_657308 [Pterula gracilis]